MWFQDLFNYDFRRTEMCIIPYATQMGEISFCAYNTGVGWRKIVEKMHMNATTIEWFKTQGSPQDLRRRQVGAARRRRQARRHDSAARRDRRRRRAAAAARVRQRLRLPLTARRQDAMKLHPDEMALARAYDAATPFEGLTDEQMLQVMTRGRELFHWFKAHRRRALRDQHRGAARSSSRADLLAAGDAAALAARGRRGASTARIVLAAVVGGARPQLADVLARASTRCTKAPRTS